MMHVSAVLVLGHVRLPSFFTHPSRPAPQEGEALEVEIDREESPSNAPGDSIATEPSTFVSGAIARTSGSISALNSRVIVNQDAHGNIAPQEPVIVAPPADSNWTFNTLAPGAPNARPNLYAGALNGLANNAPPPEERAQTTGLPAIKPSKSGGLIEALDAKDKAMGLGRGGPVLATVEDAAHSPDTPAEGFAEYEVVVSKSGAVKVAFLRADDHHESWAKITGDIERGVS